MEETNFIYIYVIMQIKVKTDRWTDIYIRMQNIF